MSESAPNERGAADLSEQIVALCRRVLQDANITLDSAAAAVEKWDSLGHMDLITALEEQFGIELDIMEMAEVDNLRALVDVVAAALRATGKR